MIRTTLGVVAVLVATLVLIGPESAYVVGKSALLVGVWLVPVMVVAVAVNWIIETRLDND